MTMSNLILFTVQIVAMIVSSSSKYVIVGTDNGSIIVYNTQSNKISSRFDDPDAGTLEQESLINFNRIYQSADPRWRKESLSDLKL